MNDNITSREIINAFGMVMPYLVKFFEDDVSFSVTDCEKFLKVENCPNLPLKPREGDQLPEGTAAKRAVKSGEMVISDIPKEIAGIPIKAYAIPVIGEKGQVEGALCFAKSLARKAEVLELSKCLSESLSQISTTINELASGVQEVVSMNSDVLYEVKNANEKSKNTDDILKFVKGVSSRTTLLGLNASIEAAKAGETGRGFSVVAQEIRKLAESTTESIKRIDMVIEDINKSISGISSKINESSNIFESQAAALEEIAASVQELNSTAQVLEELAEKI
jgi:archaellum component FlaC